MRNLKIFWLLPLFMVLWVGAARAQDVRIVYPQEGQDVRGEITARFEGIPSGGYALVKIDGQFRQATAQDFIAFDTISDRVTFARGDGAYRLEITVLNAGGKRVGTDSVAFNVANSKVDPTGDSVKLVHWTPQDRLEPVQRYRVFAESNATITGGEVAGGSGGGSSSTGGGADETVSYIPAPLDWQVSALLRRVVRDVGLLGGSANISTIVQEGFERQRLSESGAAGGVATAVPVVKAGKHKKKKTMMPSAPVKAPWNEDVGGRPLWNAAPETGKYFIKMIQQNGTEINATRKAASVAIADLMPTFPDTPVRPGSTWETTMSFVGDLSSRLPINVRAPITFTAYESLQTPSGENRRCAKLESRFRLPDNLAKRIAANLANKSGSAAVSGAVSGAGNAGTLAPGGAETAVDTGLTEDDIEIARTDMARVLWFDVERRRVLRAEDIIRSNFEIPATETDGEAAAAPTEPTSISYDLRVTTWMDDRVPNPTGQYVPGGANAHSRDSVSETGLSRILQPIASP